MGKIVLLVGGVGGAKLAYGLYHTMPPEDLTVIVNTGDDFWHHGLRICPDLDTVMYTLSGLVDKTNGWGVANDTTHALDAMRRYNSDEWFRLGDKDIATHLLRTQWWHEGITLSEITRRLASALGISCTLLPMTNGEVPTIVHTQEYGTLGFQEYFVKHRWQPTITSLEYLGADETNPAPAVIRAIESADAVIIAPSNPWLSVRPILSLHGMTDLLISRDMPRIVVTPLIQGNAVKGPTAKLMGELGLSTTPTSIMTYYGAVINGFLGDSRDESVTSAPESVQIRFADTFMDSDEKRITLSKYILQWLTDWNAS
ncbi:MAG: 2-phospho-L-lactate transferase [Anaerolineae bacterium]|nr:2-phospho-L-lactate transferase [Anaerolineae bacterium]